MNFRVPASRFAARVTLAVAIFPVFLAAQEPEFAQDPVAISPPPTLPRSGPSPTPHRRYGTDLAFYASAHLLHPLTLRDIEMRGSVEALGADRHRFVRCRLRDGSSVTGAISRIDQTGCNVTRGAIGERRLRYSELQHPPQPVIVPGEHALVGLEWAALVGLGIVVAPVILVAWSLGFVSD